LGERRKLSERPVESLSASAMNLKMNYQGIFTECSEGADYGSVGV
jgi:hypothetical protein